MRKVNTKIAMIMILSTLFTLGGCELPSEEPEPVTYIPLEVVEAVDGETVTDSNGISLSIPEGSAGEGELVFLEASEAEGDLLDEIEERYTVKSLFYHFAVRGEKDGVGWVELSFPTDDSNVQIMAIVNGIYCFPLAEEPEEGQISVEALLGPEEAFEHPVETLVAGGDVRYALVSPKSEMPAMQANQSTGLRFKEWANHSTCSDDLNKISFGWLKTAPITREVVEAMIREIVKYQGDYAALGFKAAKVTPKRYLRILIQSGIDNPSYAFEAKYIMLPPKYVYPFSDVERYAVYHELFHWIEDWQYEVHPLDTNKQNKFWWLEVAAENGTFLVDPINIEINAKVYGRRAHALGGPLGVQMSILDWTNQDPARYIHAQLLKINMCGDYPLCAMSQQEFVNIINSGGNPDLEIMCESDNMEEYGRYLLGLAPELLNDQIPIHPTIANGTAIGDLLWSKRSSETSNDLSLVSVLPNPPRITVGTNEVMVQAKISPCGAYPLRVSNTSADPDEGKPIFPSWPVALTVEPGARVLYRLNNEEPKEHDGIKSLVLQPISENLGIPVVRVVGLGGESQDVTMKAKVATVDLSGDWVINDYEIESSTVNCNDPSNTITPTPNALKSFTTKMGAVGTFSHTAANKLKYNLDPGESLGEGTTADFNVELRYDEVKVSAQYFNATPDYNENGTVQITFKKMEFLGMDDQSDQIFWKLGEGRGTTTWTRVIKKVNDQGQSYEVSCSGNSVYKVECEITTVEEVDDDPTTTTTTTITTTTTTASTTTTGPSIDCTEDQELCWLNCSIIEIDAQIAYCDKFDHYSGCALDYVGCGRICLAYSQYWCNMPGYLLCLDPVVSDHHSCVENCNAQMVSTPDYGDRMFILYTCGAVCSEDNTDGCLCTFETESLNCKNEACNTYCTNQGFDSGHWVYYTPSQGYDACECIEAEE